MHSKLFQFFSLLLLCLLAFSGRAAGLEFYPSQLTSGLRPVLNLQGEWKGSNSETFTVPFTDFKNSELSIKRTFDLPGLTDLPDTLFLYLESVAWSAEVHVNGRLITVSEDPFAEHLLPLQKEWLKETNNLVEVRMSREGPDYHLYPRHFMGLFRQVLLLEADPLAPPLRLAPKIAASSRAIVIAGWTSAQNFLYDTLPIRQALKGLFSYPYGAPVLFPFRPSSRSLAFVARRGIAIANGIEGLDSLGFYNYYPVSEEPVPLHIDFWRDSGNIPLHSYGEYTIQSDLNAPRLKAPNKFQLLIFLFLPVLGMLLLQMLAGRIYTSLPEYVTKSKIYLELIGSNKFMREQPRWLMNLFRWMISAVVVSLYLYYVQQTATWSRLNILSSNSLLFEIYGGVSQPLYQLFFEVFAFVAGLNLLKYFMLNVIGTIYRLHPLTSMSQNLDVFAAFPLNLLPLLPAAFVFFVEAGTGTILLQIWYIFFLLYFVRRIVIVYIGLSRLLQFSTSLKILYICTLEIAPWVFLI